MTALRWLAISLLFAPGLANAQAPVRVGNYPGFGRVVFEFAKPTSFEVAEDGAQLLITNDGGPGHFASLTPIRTLVFFGPETGKLYGPLGSRATVLESGLACSPCLSAYNHRQTFCDGDNQCLQRIAPDPVLAEADVRT